MHCVYILQLEDNKYYVGKSENPYTRLQNHFDGAGSCWTSKYRPTNVVQVIQNCNGFDEDKYTIEYMAKYGIENVRGGSFSSMILSKEEINVIDKMIIGATDKCYKCGQNESFCQCM